MLATRRLLDASQLAAAARLFSSSVLQEMARKGKSPLVARLAKESGLTVDVDSSEPVRNLFDMAFSLLKKKNYRHEYIYKAAITHKILLGTHSLETAAMMTEFRVRTCKADVVILNGTSTVYEIKSERDKLSRLQDQISAYRQAFAKVNVITGENHLNAVLAIAPEDVGVMLLTDRFQISTIREAAEVPSRTVPEVIFDSLQLQESKSILELLGVQVPDMPNTKIYQFLRQKFSNLSPCEVHDGMAQVLRKTRSSMPLAGLVGTLPSSLWATALSSSLRQQDHMRLLEAMDVPVQEAINWG